MTKVDDRSVVCYVVCLCCGGRRIELDTAALIGAIARGSDCTSLWSIDTMVRTARATHYVRPQLLAGAEGHTRGREGGLPYQVLLAEGLNPLASDYRRRDSKDASPLGREPGQAPNRGGLPRRALRPCRDRPLTAETRRIVDDAATAGLSLIDLDRPRAGGPAAHDRPHCLAVEIIALRQVLDGDESHGNLRAGVRLLSAIRGISARDARASYATHPCSEL